MKKYDVAIKDKIITLRGKGYTFREIQQEVGMIPKATLSYICRNIEMPDFYQSKVKHLNQLSLVLARQAANISKERSMLKRLHELDAEAERVIKSSSKMDKHKVALSLLYLGEGRKRRSFRGLSLGGSDVNTLKIYISLLRICYGLDSRKFKAAIQYRADQDLDKLKQFWAVELGFCEEQFYATYPDPRTIGKSTRRNDYMGVCVVTCSGADIQLELSLIAEKYAKKLWGYSSAD